MKVLLIIIFSSLIFVAGCSNPVFEGMVTDKRIVDEKYEILVIQGITSTDIQNLSLTELIDLGMREKKKAIYFTVDKANYEKLSVGTYVQVTHKKEVMTSYPAQTGATKISIITK
ncbi:DUF3221 domain-containing protein [Peribacillus alkalitolerans]|uniref:DUF3221 domain-containing protein n=1 Tax=Peribacillus alkalitolerans TaxID=1550385 RepID=UPI0013CF8164|nr:DUF3221 domain-containing protein [Peribacillus alkalitolerans]